MVLVLKCVISHAPPRKRSELIGFRRLRPANLRDRLVVSTLAQNVRCVLVLQHSVLGRDEVSRTIRGPMPEPVSLGETAVAAWQCPYVCWGNRNDRAQRMPPRTDDA